MFTVYHLNVDFETNKLTIMETEKNQDENEWDTYINRIRYKLEGQGIYVPPDTCNVLVTLRKMDGIQFINDKEGSFYEKTYDD